MCCMYVHSLYIKRASKNKTPPTATTKNQFSTAWSFLKIILWDSLKKKKKRLIALILLTSAILLLR